MFLAFQIMNQNFLRCIFKAAEITVPTVRTARAHQVYPLTPCPILKETFKMDDMDDVDGS